MDDFILSQLKSFFYPKSMLLPWKAMKGLDFCSIFEKFSVSQGVQD